MLKQTLKIAVDAEMSAPREIMQPPSVKMVFVRLYATKGGLIWMGTVRAKQIVFHRVTRRFATGWTTTVTVGWTRVLNAGWGMSFHAPPPVVHREREFAELIAGFPIQNTAILLRNYATGWTMTVMVFATMDLNVAPVRASRASVRAGRKVRGSVLRFACGAIAFLPKRCAMGWTITVTGFVITEPAWHVVPVRSRWRSVETAGREAGSVLITAHGEAGAVAEARGCVRRGVFLRAQQPVVLRERKPARHHAHGVHANRLRRFLIFGMMIVTP